MPNIYRSKAILFENHGEDTHTHTPSHTHTHADRSLYTATKAVGKTPFTRYNRLSNRLLSNPFDNRFDNPLYRVNKHPTGYQTGCGLTTALNEQLFVQCGCQTGLYPVVKPVDNRLYRVNGALKCWPKNRYDMRTSRQ